MLKNISFVLFLIFLLCPIKLNAETQDSNAIIVSELLFPETVNWKRLTDYPHVDQQWLNENRWKLRELYLGVTDYDVIENPECSYITRVLYEKANNENFFMLDLNGDGNKEVIYTGPAECQEGDQTVIWSGVGVESLREKQKAIIVPGKILKVVEGQTQKFSSVIYGCCAELVNQYSIWSAGVIEQRVGIPTTLVLKKEAVVSVRNLVVKDELVLRSEPEIIDDYNEGLSHRQNHAVFGNIIRKYLPGVECKQLLKYIDNGGKEWALVVVPWSENRRSYHTPMPINVGWTQL